MLALAKDPQREVCVPGHYIHIAAADRVVALFERLDVWKQRHMEVPNFRCPASIRMAPHS